MSEFNNDSKRASNGPTAPKTILTAGAVVAALAGGYALRGTQVTAQQADPNASTKTPIVQTPATTDAASMQKAFNQVSNAIEPAVVTITTRRSVRPVSSTGPRGRMQPFGGGEGEGANPFGGGGSGGDPFEDFFRQFRRFQPENWQPNSAEKDALRARFYEMQSGRGGGGLGSGMIYREDGYIITNAHVVKDASSVTVKLNDGREFKDAKVIGSDERTDVAVVKITSPAKLPVVRLGDSGRVNVGDWAIAVGNPFGLEHTVTVGVISAKAREVALSERNSDYLQTDASINPGNSGGPLCDIYGRVIGVNNAIYSQSGGNVGIGFAIPINTAKNIADRLVQNGKITRSYLGVGIKGVEDAQTAAGLELDPSVRGVLIDQVPDADAPGAKAGLQPGDVVTEFNGQKVTRASELQRLVGDAPVGSNATIKVLRGGQERTLTAKLEELKDEPATLPTRTTPNEEKDDATTATTVQGMQLRTITPQIARRFELKETRGVVVTGVDENSAAADAGVRPGDIIERVGQTPVTSPAEIKSNVDRLLQRQSGANKSVGLYVNRGGQKRFFFLDVR